jgi:hypothetical protein
MKVVFTTGGIEIVDVSGISGSRGSVVRCQIFMFLYF